MFPVSGNRSSFKTMYNTIRVAFAFFLLTLLIRVLSYFDLIEGFRKPTGQSFVTNLLFLAGCAANLLRIYRRKAPPEDAP